MKCKYCDKTAMYMLGRNAGVCADHRGAALTRMRRVVAGADRVSAQNERDEREFVRRLLTTRQYKD